LPFHNVRIVERERVGASTEHSKAYRGINMYLDDLACCDNANCLC